MKKGQEKQEDQSLRNYVAKHMFQGGNCGLQVVEDKKAKHKRGEGKNSFNPSKMRDHY